MSRRILTFSLFEATKNAGLTPEQEEFLNKYTKGSWTYNSSTGLVDVDGDFDCSEQGLSDFKGVRFGKVSGDFGCEENRLTSLEGAPQKVGESFSCTNNRLTTLEGAPREVGRRFECRNNQLTTLNGAPQKVGGGFYCSNNQLTTLEGVPQEVGGGFSCDANQLTTLEGAPREVGYFSCENNKLLTSLEGAPQKVYGYFYCDAFRRVKWNIKTWFRILEKGKPEARRLILTFFPAEDLNQEIRKDPTGMIMKLKEVWNDESFRETRDKLVWPKGYEEEAGLVGDLDDVGF